MCGGISSTHPLSENIYDNGTCYIRFSKLTMYISSGPFCGVNLYDYYKSDEYVNGIEGEAFKLLRIKLCAGKATLFD